jgi:hypothetical protein
MRPFDVAIVPDPLNPMTVTVADGLEVNATIVNPLAIDVSVTNTPSVNATVVGTPNVAVTNTPAVTISGTPTVSATISNTPNVAVTNTPSVNATVVGTPSVNATVVGTPNVAVTNTPTVNIGTMPSVTATTSSAPINSDAGGRTRISSITTLFDGKILNADDTLLFQNVGTGTGTYSNNSYIMSVTAGQYLIRQARRFNPYFSGKSQLFEPTYDSFHPEAGVVKRAGYFSSNTVAPHDSNKDGSWIESDGTTIRLLVSNFGTEKLNLPLTSWSGYANLAEYQTPANWQNFTVNEADFLWLGGAVLRLFVKVSTGFVLAHQFNYAGSAQGPFMRSPNQPLRYEIRSTSGTGSMRYICSQVATEGSINESGKSLSLFNTASITCNNVGTIYALKSVRKSATYRDNAIQVIGMEVVNGATTDSGILMLILNPTLSGAITYAANSLLEEGTPTTQTITAGTGRVIAAIAVGSSSAGTQIMKDNFLAYLGGTITNVFDEIVLAYMPTTNNQTINGVLTVKEY